MHRPCCAVAIAALLAAPAAAQITLNNTATANAGTAAVPVSTLSWAFTANAGSNRVIAVTIGSEVGAGASTNGLVTGVSFNGTNLSLVAGSRQVVSTTSITDGSEIWFAVLPGSGAVPGTVAVTYTGPVRAAVGASVALNNVNPSALVVGAGSTAGTEAVAANTISTAVATTAANAWLLDYGIHGSSTATGLFTTGTNHTAYTLQPTADLVAGLGRVQDIATAGTTTLGWSGQTGATGNRLTHSVAGFAPVPEPAFGLVAAVAGLAGWRRWRS